MAYLVQIPKPRESLSGKPRTGSRRDRRTHDVGGSCRTDQEGKPRRRGQGVQEEFQFRNLSGDPSKGPQVDGIFGPATEASVRGFECSWGSLPADRVRSLEGRHETAEPAQKRGLTPGSTLHV